jgi:hypothetical protein
MLLLNLGIQLQYYTASQSGRRRSEIHYIKLKEKVKLSLCLIH